MNKKIKELKKREAQAEIGGGLEKIKKQRQAGKLTARNRIQEILDPDSFQETDKLVTDQPDSEIYGDGVVTGTGTINGRKVCIFSQDFTVYGGSLARLHAQKIVKIMDLAAKVGCPLIGINDSGGARIQDGVESLAGYADIFYRNVKYSGVIPQISLVLGPCAGGAVYSPALTDFIFMVDGISHMFVTGPDVLKAVTREDVDKESLGGTVPHTQKSGVVTDRFTDETSCFKAVRDLLQFLPNSFSDAPPALTPIKNIDQEDLELNKIIPESNNLPYDMRLVIKHLADQQKFFELQTDYAKNILIGFIHLDGKPTGIIANQPKYLAGCLDINASLKAARFVRFCNAFNIQILTLVDVPGFLPGVNQEHGGIIKHGAKLLYAFAESQVPRITLITRKAYGGAYDVMNSKHIGADFNFAWPSAEIAVMGAEGAINILAKRDLQGLTGAELKAKQAELIKSYEEEHQNPWLAASLGYVDAVIEPQKTRSILISSYRFLAGKKREPFAKHNGNIPL